MNGGGFSKNKNSVRDKNTITAIIYNQGKYSKSQLKLGRKSTAKINIIHLQHKIWEAT